MDFFNDQILSDLDRADYIGGIDNEYIFFEDIHITGLNRLDGICNQANASHTNDTDTAGILGNTKVELAHIATPSAVPTASNKEPLLTVLPNGSACLGVNNTAITPGLHGTNAQLPDSPPDSSSEPPYSPIEDVAMLAALPPTRLLYNHSSTASAAATLTTATTAAAAIIHQDLPAALHQQQNTAASSHQCNHLASLNQEQQHQFSQLTSYTNPLNANVCMNPVQDNLITSGIQVKRESSPNISRANLLSATPQIGDSLDTQLNSPAAQLMYSNANQLNYDNFSGKIFSTTSPPPPYPTNHPTSDASLYMLNTVADLPHVQVIGTSHASIPSTPQLSRTSTPSTPNSLSRKRKMTTQIDGCDYSNIKPDPGLTLSPTRNKNCATTLQLANGPKLTPLSPINIQIHNNNCNATNNSSSKNLGLNSNNNSNINPCSDLNDTLSSSGCALSPVLPPATNPNADNISSDGHSSIKTISDAGASDAANACIRFSPFQPQNWHKLCDQNLQELAIVYYRVDADKGFNFSASDDAFVCQKKNHFQITCHARLQGDAKFVKISTGLEKIKSFHLHFYGVKLETPNQIIRIEQSQSDRSKKPFYPVPIDLQSHVVSKITVGRLHFSETTNNNMRKKGRPNPEQRYFQLIVALHVHTASGDFPVISQGSDKIIVRASNPGQFESDGDFCWQRGLTQDSIYHAGRVGINTDRPDESLVVHGNLKISGHIVQPSDSRAKQEIGELDTSVQLRNLQKIRIVRYRLEPEFALHSGLKAHRDNEDIVDTGVIAQEVREVIPDAVQEAGSVVLPNGNIIENFLLVNKDRILMENIGAVKELCKVTGTLQTRIENLERGNHCLHQAKDNNGLNVFNRRKPSIKDGYEICSNRNLQISIFILIIIMAACLAAVSTLYFVEHNKKEHIFKHLESVHVLSNGHLYRPDAGIILSEKDKFYLHNNWNKSKSYHPYFQTSAHIAGGRNFTKHRNNSDTALLLPITANEAGLSALQTPNDELKAVMEKPSAEYEIKQLPHRPATMSMVLRSNKTLNSKTKIKPQQLTRNTVLRSKNGHNSGNEDTAQTAHMTGRAVIAAAFDIPSEPIPSSIQQIQQDLDTNSIDVDAKQRNPNQKTTAAKTSPPRAKDSTQLRNMHNLSSDGNRSNANNPSPNQANSLRRTNAVVQQEASVFKTLSPLLHNTAVISSSTTAKTNNRIQTDAPNTNSSVEIQPITNKSRPILDRTTDNAEDLQNLNNNNESAYNIIGDPLDLIFYNNIQMSGLLESKQEQQQQQQQQQQTKDNGWMKALYTYIEIIGETEQCNSKLKHPDANVCQSLCYKENSNAQMLEGHRNGNLDEKPTGSYRSRKLQTNKSIISTNSNNSNASDTNSNSNQDNTDAFLQDNEDELQSNYDDATAALNVSKLIVVGGKSSHPSQLLAKQINAAGTSKNLEHLDSIPKDNTDVPGKNSRKERQILMNQTAIHPNNSSHAVEKDCWNIRSSIITEHSNTTFSSDDYCPKLSKSLNVTFEIPLSRYFKESSIQLHLISSIPLQWTVCSAHDQSKANSKGKINSTYLYQTQKILQRLRNTSVLPVSLPRRGYFLEDISLRATTDMEKQNVCQEKPHASYPVLQYNFRIQRECD